MSAATRSLPERYDLWRSSEQGEIGEFLEFASINEADPGLDNIYILWAQFALVVAIPTAGYLVAFEHKFTPAIEDAHAVIFHVTCERIEDIIVKTVRVVATTIAACGV